MKGGPHFAKLSARSFSTLISLSASRSSSPTSTSPDFGAGDSEFREGSCTDSEASQAGAQQKL